VKLERNDDAPRSAFESEGLCYLARLNIPRSEALRVLRQSSSLEMAVALLVSELESRQEATMMDEARRASEEAEDVRKEAMRRHESAARTHVRSILHIDSGLSFADDAHTVLLRPGPTRSPLAGPASPYSSFLVKRSHDVKISHSFRCTDVVFFFGRSSYHTHTETLACLFGS
jgi:hypothetical protein